MKFLLNFIIVLTVMLTACTKKQTVKQELVNSEWSFRKAGDSLWLPATVPGCVHTDLLDNKIIPDPFFRTNELEVKWVESEDWEYFTTFEVRGEIASLPNISLEFLGLDTYADVYLNDSLILKADNMFLGWMIPVNTIVKSGKNTLRIYFHSAVKVGMEKLRKVPYTLMAANEIAPENERSNVFTRKAPFHYGWDWGPRLVTCGIWRPVKIHAWDNLKMNGLYVKPVLIDTVSASYSAVIEFSAIKKTKVNFELWLDSAMLISTSEAMVEPGNNLQEIEFTIDKPELWWTNGLGGQKLYMLEVKMLSGSNTIQSITERIGVRSLELVQEKDHMGHSFLFKLNGVPVFMKGANYIPSDIFLTRNTLENYKRVVDDAVKANMNMLRVWGGAVYEGDEFYNLLDENGILAWNDFMFACNLQPDDSLHLENIRKEAEYNVKRLRNHPSVALWCGNNENLTAWFGWKWKDRFTPEVSEKLWRVYEDIYYRILPGAVKKYHPTVSYWPSSPQTIDNKVADRLSGDEHDWSVWFANAPFAAYSEKVPRFVSEYGLQSFPELATLMSFADFGDMEYRSPVMEHRQRSNMPWIAPGFNGNEMIKSYMAKYYKVPEKFVPFVYISQINQSDGIKFAIESHRRNMPHCMGSLYWQINDCWPTMSWSSVDYFGRWKTLHYSVQDAFQAVYPIIWRDKENIRVTIANDRLASEKITLSARLYNFNGQILWEKQTDTLLVANSSLNYLSVPEKKLLSMGSPFQLVFEAEVKSGDQVLSVNHFYFRDTKDLKLQNPMIKSVITKSGEDEYTISLSSEKLAKNVGLFTMDAKGFFSDNNFDLIPGKKYTVTYNGKTTNFTEKFKIKSMYEAYNF